MKLFKKSKTGAVRVWWPEINGSSYRFHSGQLNGKITISKWKEAKAKNVGRSNATTAEEQAILEVDRHIVKKMEEGFVETIDDVDNVPVWQSPMLANKYETWPSNEPFVIVQPKLDGVRCIARADGLWSRGGKRLPSCGHIVEAMKPFFEVYPDAIVDGELYSHDLRDNFNEIISLVKKKSRAEEAAKVIKFWVYDLVSDMGYLFRYHDLTRTVLLSTGNVLIMTPFKAAYSEEELMTYFEEITDAGFEGAMVRLKDSGYDHCRSKSLLKMKEFRDEEFTIVRLEEGTGNNSGMVGKVLCRNADGQEFRANMTGTWTYCKDLLADADAYIGGEATVRYFELTPDGIPRFPVATTVYKNRRDI